MSYKITYEGSVKRLSSPEYNYIFDMSNGTMLKWGKTIKDDPDYSPVGPEIFDIEVTERCAGIHHVATEGKIGFGTPSSKRTPCSWCYKANRASEGSVMDFQTFKRVFDQLPDTVTQIAFGADAQCKTCPDIWKMMDYCREHNVVPNITVADVDKETSKLLAARVGAVAVSYYGNENVFRTSLENLKSAGVKVINCHVLISKETMLWVDELIDGWDTVHNRLGDLDFIGYESYLNAIVCLSLKQCGRGTGFTQITQHEYTLMVKKFLDKDIGFGSDSCGATKIVNAFKALDKKVPYELLQPCESTCESGYLSASGFYYPCSFNEKEEYAIDSNDVEDFVKDVWFSKKWNMFRDRLLANYRNCPSYKV